MDLFAPTCECPPERQEDAVVVTSMQPERPPLPTETCLLCGQPSSVLGVFVPDDPQAWGAAVGKARFIAYGLCPTCYVVLSLTGKGTADRIEKKLAEGVKPGGPVGHPGRPADVAADVGADALAKLQA